MKTESIFTPLLYSYNIYRSLGLWSLHAIVLRHNFKNPTSSLSSKCTYSDSPSFILANIHFRWMTPSFTLHAEQSNDADTHTVPSLPCSWGTSCSAGLRHSLLSRCPHHFSSLISILFSLWPRDSSSHSKPVQTSWMWPTNPQGGSFFRLVHNLFL